MFSGSQAKENCLSSSLTQIYSNKGLLGRLPASFPPHEASARTGKLIFTNSQSIYYQLGWKSSNQSNPAQYIHVMAIVEGCRLEPKVVHRNYHCGNWAQLAQKMYLHHGLTHTVSILTHRRNHMKLLNLTKFKLRSMRRIEGSTCWFSWWVNPKSLC